MNIIRFDVGDTLLLKKKHPCGCSTFLVLKTGSDIKIRCEGCGHEMLISREKAEKHITKVISKNG